MKASRGNNDARPSVSVLSDNTISPSRKTIKYRYDQFDSKRDSLANLKWTLKQIEDVKQIHKKLNETNKMVKTNDFRQSVNGFREDLDFERDDNS